MLADYRFKLDFSVRDYECDLVGMVNHAAYFNYLEHTRHEFLVSRGVNFAELANQGIYLIVVRIEVDYLFPLRSGDRFAVGLNAYRISCLRLGFDQEIHRLPDEVPVLRAKLVASAVNERGRPYLPEGIMQRILGEDRAE